MTDPTNNPRNPEGKPDKRPPPTPAQITKIKTALEMMDMRAMGASYFEIAEHFGVTRQAAHAAVIKALDYQREKLAEKVEQVRALELMRLDQLHLTYYPRALEGDEKAADRVLDIMTRRARYTGADAPVKVAPTDPSGTGPATLIREYVGIDPEEV